MEIGLNKTSISCYKKVYSGNITREESAESVVPDVLPDICEIISTNGMVYLRSKEPSAGKLSLSGTVSAIVLYLPEGETCPKKMSVELPFTISAESAAITEQVLSTASVSLSYIEARATNPRKIYIRAGLCARIDGYMPDELAFGTELSDNCEIDIHTKAETVTADIISGVWEKTFILTDEFPLTGGKAVAQELIGQSVELSTEDVKFVGTKMIFKGIVKTDLLWSGEDGSLNASAFTSSFSQIMELGIQPDTANAQVDLMLTGAYLEIMHGAGDSRTVSAELHILAQAACTENRELSYIADAYSNTCALEQQRGASVELHTDSPVVLRDNMRGLIETTYQVRDVVQVLPEVGQWSSVDSGFSCPINVKLLLRDEEGSLRALVRSFTAKWEQENDDGLELQAVRCAELYAAPAAGGVEVRMLAQAYGLSRRVTTVVPLEVIVAHEELPVDLSVFPSVVVLPEKCCDLWELAKRYHSTEELIKAANSGIDGSVLLIPRAR